MGVCINHNNWSTTTEPWTDVIRERYRGLHSNDVTANTFARNLSAYKLHTLPPLPWPPLRRPSPSKSPASVMPNYRSEKRHWCPIHIVMAGMTAAAGVGVGDWILAQYYHTSGRQPRVRIIRDRRSHSM